MGGSRHLDVHGRVSLQPRHITAALPEDERVAVEALETHLFQRGHRPEPSFEVLADGTVGVFLTISHMQKLLRQIGSRKTGEDFAAETLNTILPRLGLIEDTGLTKKPGGGGRHAQPTTTHSYWWRVFRLPTLAKLLTPRFGAYPKTPGNPEALTLAPGSASLVGLLRCQGVISGWKRRTSFLRGSVQGAFQATGPP
jgi:hypothetical protein